MKSPFLLQSEICLNPAVNGDMHYWADRFGISVKMLENIIIDTGWTSIDELKNYFRKYNPLRYYVRSVICTIKYPAMHLAYVITRYEYRKLKNRIEEHLN